VGGIIFYLLRKPKFPKEPHLSVQAASVPSDIQAMLLMRIKCKLEARAPPGNRSIPGSQEYVKSTLITSSSLKPFDVYIQFEETNEIEINDCKILKL
jgi:hypothetical protein